jgi:hypothetical protein
MTADDRSKQAIRIIDLLVKVAHCVEPADHVGGRIRLRVSLSGLPKLLTLLRGIDVDEGARTIPGLKGYEVSAWTLSAAIRYDPEVLPEDLWNDFCAIGKKSGAEAAFRSRFLELLENHSGRAADGEFE